MRDSVAVAAPAEREGGWSAVAAAILPRLARAVPGWGVLKNAEQLPRITGDLDLVVPRERWDEWVGALRTALSSHGRFSIVTCDHWPRMRVVLVVNEDPDGTEGALEIDLVDLTWSRGAPALRAHDLVGEMLEDPRGFRRLGDGAQSAVLFNLYAFGRRGRLDHEALARHPIQALAGSDPAGFARSMRAAWGRAGARAAQGLTAGTWSRWTGLSLALARSRRWGTGLPARCAAWLHRRAIGHWRGLPRAVPDGAAVWRGRVARGHRTVAVNAPAPSRGRWVVLCGPDGTGKSGLARAVASQAADGRIFHWRPGLLPRLGAMAGRAAPDPTRPHAAAPYGRAVSLARLLYYWLDHVLGSQLVIRRAVRRGAVVVVERGYFDMAVDRARYRLGVPAGLVRVLGALVPKPDVTIVLDGDPAVVASRKGEISAEETARQIDEWRRLAGGRGWTQIDATRSIADVTRAVLDQVAPGGHGD